MASIMASTSTVTRIHSYRASTVICRSSQLHRVPSPLARRPLNYKPNKPLLSKPQRLVRRRSASRPAQASSSVERDALFQKIQKLPSPIFPGGQSETEAAHRKEIDEMVAELERSSPVKAPLAPAARKILAGKWALLYASAGTVVTKSTVGTIIRTLSVLPFVGLAEVEQDLIDTDGKLKTSNAAVFGLGPIGSWQVTISGTWDVLSDTMAKVVFSSYSVHLQGFFGIKIPALKLELPTPANQAEFSTTYLDNDGTFRISREMFLMEYATRVFKHAISDPCLASIQDSAHVLSECPNYWVARDVIEAGGGVIPAEAAVAQLYDLVKDQLPQHWSGAEYWVQIYEGGRGLAFHMDKDEHAMTENQAVINPLLSSVLYLTGTKDGKVQAPTVINDQKYDHNACEMTPVDPTSSTFVFPRTNSYTIFDGRLGHGVLDCGHDDRRVTFLVNWWACKPQNIDKIEDDGVEVMLPAAMAAGAAERPLPECAYPEEIIIQEEAVDDADILMMDDILKHHGISLTGKDAKQAVIIKHAGLSLYPIDQEQLRADNGDDNPLVIGAAILRMDTELDSSSSSDISDTSDAEN